MNAQQRLEKYRKNAEESNAAYLKNYKSVMGFTWRDRRYPKPFTKDKPRHKNEYYAESWDDTIFKFEGYADQFASIHHTGWYTDDDGDLGTIRGVVLSFRNPHKLSEDGHIFYIAGTEHSEWENMTYFPRDIYDNTRDAAYAADNIAERAAEEECDSHREYQRQQDIENAREEIHFINKKALPLIKEIKKADPFTPAICAALKDSIEELLAERRRLFKRISYVD